MIAGLPWTAWLLWIVAIGLDLAIELVFYYFFRFLDVRASSRRRKVMWAMARPSGQGRLTGWPSAGRGDARGNRSALGTYFR